MRDEHIKLYGHIAKKLIDAASTVAVAESVTGGLLQHAFTEMENASQFFQGGLTAYNLGQKVKHLSVEPIHAAACNCVSPEVAAQMALQANRLFLSEWGIGITGYASVEAPLDGDLFAFFAIARHEVIVTSGRLTRSADVDPALVQEYYVNEVLTRLLSTIQS